MMENQFDSYLINTESFKVGLYPGYKSGWNNYIVLSEPEIKIIEITTISYISDLKIGLIYINESTGTTIDEIITVSVDQKIIIDPDDYRPDGYDRLDSFGFWIYDNYLFKSQIVSITIPESVTTIGSRAFYGCTGLKSITIPQGVTTIGASAFYGCTGLKSITIPQGVTTIGAFAFCDCTGLTSITIPNNVTTIDEYAFSGCSSLTEFTSENIFNTNWFYRCNTLEKVTLGKDVTEIYFIGNCLNQSLSNITILATSVPTLQDASTYTGSIYVLPDLVDNYKASTNWSKYAELIYPIQ